MTTMKYINRTLRYDIVSHCNLTCYSCSRVAPYANTNIVSLEQFKKDLSRLSKYYIFRDLKIVGGEVLLCKNICEYLKYAKEINIAKRIHLYTNGILLHKQQHEFWSLIDLLYVSIYPSVKNKIDKDYIKEMAAKTSIEVILDDCTDFYEQVLDYPINDHELVKRIYYACLLKRECNTIYNGTLYRCSVAPFIDDYLRNTGNITTFKESDGLSIHNNSDMRDVIYKYLYLDEPLQSCNYCLGSAGKSVKHHMMTMNEIRHVEKKRKVEDLLDQKRLANGISSEKREKWINEPIREYLHSHPRIKYMLRPLISFRRGVLRLARRNAR